MEMKVSKWCKQRTFFSYILLIILFIPFITNMTKGIDVTDTCYLLARYKYVFDRNVEVNSFTILFTELIGGFLYQIVPEYQVLLLTLTSWGLNVAIAILTYRLLQNYVNRILLMATIIAGSTFTIASFHVLHYDIISMFFQVVAFSLLVDGLTSRKGGKIAFSGFLIGINIFIRLPNILQVIFVIPIFWFEMGKEKKERKTRSYAKKFVMGVTGGCILGLIICLWLLGQDVASKTLFGTLSLLTNSTSAYGTGSIITRFFESLMSGAKLAIKNEGYLLLFILILFLYENLSHKYENIKFYQGLKLLILLETIFVIVIAVWSGIGWFYVDTLEILVINFILILGIGSICFYKTDIKYSTICCGTLLMELILTIGTNNGSYFFVIFMAFPAAVSISVLCKGFKEKKHLSIKGCKYLLVAYLAGLLIASGVQFYKTYVYRDAPQELLTCEVGLKEFKGIRTSRERAAYIDNLKELLNPYEDYQLLTLGDFNIGYVITDMIPFFSRPWPDLENFRMETFQEEMENKFEQGIYPVIVLADIYQTGTYRDMDKYEKVLSIAEGEKYRLLYEDSYYRIYIPISMEG